MTRHRIVLITLLFILASVIASGCTQAGTPASSTTSAVTERNIPFDAIQTDAETYNIGEVVEFELTNKTPGRGKCDDHPCSYRLLKLAANGTWQFMDWPENTWTAAPGTVQYEPGCYPLHFSTNEWTPGQYRIQYACGVYKIFTVREVPVIAGQ